MRTSEKVLNHVGHLNEISSELPEFVQWKPPKYPPIYHSLPNQNLPPRRVDCGPIFEKTDQVVEAVSKSDSYWIGIYLYSE
jgi:hypothetical protein